MFVWWLTFFFTLLIDLVPSFRGKKKVQLGFFFLPTICTPCSVAASAARPPPKHFHSSQLQNRIFFLQPERFLSKTNPNQMTHSKI